MDLRAQGKQVHQFEGGEPYLATPDHIKDAMSRALRDNKTRYAPSSGLMELRKAVASKVSKRNGIPARVEDVIVVNGGMTLLGRLERKSAVSATGQLSAVVPGVVKVRNRMDYVWDDERG